MTEPSRQLAESGGYREPVAGPDPYDDTAVLPGPVGAPALAPPDLPAGDAPQGAPDLATRLAAAAPRRWHNRATPYLVGVLLLIGGFLAGAQSQKAYGQPAGPGPAGPGLSRFAAGARAQASGGTGSGGTGSGGTGRQADAGGGQQTAATGTVKLVDGRTLYVQVSGGGVVTVRTGTDTAVSLATATSLKNLKAGDPVTVQGSTASDGTITATRVTGQRVR